MEILRRKKYAALYPALWEYRIEFALGKNNPLEYLDGTAITGECKMPFVKGLERTLTRRTIQAMEL